MTFGSQQTEQYGEVSKETAFSILDHFKSHGGNFIDTANFYREGESELWLGEWMQSRQNRDEIVLATKFTQNYLPSTPGRILTNTGGNGVKSLRTSLEASLVKLQTSYIDILYLHWWDYTVTIPELMTNLNDLCSQGKILYLGISDTPAWIVSKANQYARDHNMRPFVVYQGFWNAGLRDLERDIIPMTQHEGMGLCPYGVLGQGRFQTQESYTSRQKSKEGRNLIPLSDHDKKIAAMLEIIAKSKDVPLLQVALAYIRHKAPHVFPIVGARTLAHIKGSIEALCVTLSDAEIKQIESSYEFDPGFPHTFLSGTLITGEAPRGAYGPNDIFLSKVLGTVDWVEGPKPIRLIADHEKGVSEASKENEARICIVQRRTREEGCSS
jgi:aryl-alcohol dehydrogenase-like predicted oxidoreductase